MTPRQLLGQARVHTFEYVPYLASYIYSLREQEMPGIGTAAVDMDGNLYWDPEYIVSIGKETGAYLVAHEVLHLIFEHHQRTKEIIGESPSDQDKFILNIAADLVIEQTLSMMRHLRPEGAVYLGVKVPQLGITLDLPENRSMQEYYRLICEKLKQKPDDSSTPPQQGAQSDGGDDQDDDADGASDSDSDGGDEQEGDRTGGASNDASSDDEGDSEADTGGDDGTEAEGQEAPAQAGGQEGGQGKAPQKPGAPGTGGSCADGCPRPYEIDSDGSWQAYGEDLAAAKAEAAIAEMEQSRPGSVPDNIKQALQQKLRPQPDPFDQLRSAVCTSVASPVGGRDYSHRRRSRKQPPGEDDPLLHGRICVQPKAVVIVDTSGSMNNKEVQAKALSVIAQGLRKLSRVRVYCADTQVQNDAVLTSTKRFEWCGGGGTDMSTAIAQVEQDEKPDSIVLVTDAETYWTDRKPRARVVVAYTGKVGSRWHTSIPPWFRVVPLTQGS